MSHPPKNPEFLFIYCFTDWCGSCQTMHPIIEKMKESFSEKMTFLDLNMDAHPDFAKKYYVSSVPTFIVIKNQKEIWKYSGLYTLKELQKKLDQLILYNDSNRIL